jgi:hypothetical protein
MRVKALKGQRYRSYTILLPVDSGVFDLPQHIQDAIELFGELSEVHQFDLDPSNTLHKETEQKINEQGAHLWKTSAEFTEIG